MNELIEYARKVPSLFDLSGRVAVITGAAGGLGQGISLALAAAGANMVLVDLNRDKAAELAKTITDEFGRDADGFGVDISNESDVFDMAKKIKSKYGHIDILVNCAGIAVLAPALEMPLEDWRRGMKINLEGTFICCREIGRIMVEQKKGKIVNISSVRGSQGRSGYSSYASGKAAVNLLTKTLAIEWAEHGVNVNAIAPIFIRTEMNAKIVDDPENRKKILSRIPLGRLGHPSDLFGAVIYLSSEASNFVTGSILYADGGWTAA